MTPSTLKRLIPVVAFTAVYIGDNGRTLCGEHLGATAKFTGRDLSGLNLYRVKPSDVVAAGICNTPDLYSCEECGRSA